MKRHVMGSLVIVLLAIACEQGSGGGGGIADARSGSSASEAARRVAPAPAAEGSPTTSDSDLGHFKMLRVAPPAAQAVPPATTFPSSSAMADTAAPSMIIRTGTASIEVDSLEAGIAAVQALVQRVGGYVANTSMQAGRDQTHSASLQLKIPAARFDEALSGLSPIGKLESTNVQAEDVGEEFVDVSARVANARRLEERLIELLETRTGKLADVLAVERELARVRGEIERNEGRLRYLRTRVAMSTLTVVVHEPVPILGRQGSGGVIAQSFRQSWRNFVGFVAAFIEALGTLVPLTIVLALAALAAVRWVKRIRRDPGASTGESTSAA